ncbi:MAG: hypothetical protein LAO51_17935 [Acidobacteriia bacterium]|nr:hypothetical protein [Terriglobia bacterium]
MARKLSAREGVLLGVLAAAGIGYMWLTSGPDQAGRAGTARDAGAKKGNISAQRPPVVRMDLLTAKTEKYDDQGRDLFKYSQRPPSAAEIRRLREEAARRQKEMEEANKRAAEEAALRLQEAQAKAKEAVLHPQPPPPPTPPSIDLRYLGYLGPKDNRIAVFEDGKDLLVARKGEVVKGLFRVVDVKWETVVMGFVQPEFKGQTQEIAMTHGK